ICRSPPLVSAAAPNDENERNRYDDRGGNVAGPRVGRRWNSRGQARIEHAFHAEIESCDNSSDGIDNRRNTGVRGSHEGKSFLDRAQPGLLKMLIGTRADSEPAVVGEVHDPAGTVAV